MPRILSIETSLVDYEIGDNFNGIEITEIDIIGENGNFLLKGTVEGRPQEIGMIHSKEVVITYDVGVEVFEEPIGMFSVFN